MPRHKKNPDLGEKTTVFAPSILIEQADAQSFEDNEEVSRRCAPSNATIMDS